MVRIGLSLMCVTLSACGLERDWAAWQALNASSSETGTSEAGPDSTGGESTSSSSGGMASGTAEVGSETGQGEASAGTSTGSEAGETGTTGTGTTTGPAAVCGDGLVEGEEECDDPGDTACFHCIRDRLVFVTSEFEFRGDFAKSSMNLDYWCNYLGAVAGLIPDNKTPRFKPWISTSEGSAAERLHHSKGRYVLRNGLVFAQSWDALVAGEILNPLNVDENSQTRNVYVWTDTNPDGSAMPGEHCEDWNSASFELYAHYGKSSMLDGQWTMYAGPGDNPTLCDDFNAIYCFESP